MLWCAAQLAKYRIPPSSWNGARHLFVLSRVLLVKRAASSKVKLPRSAAGVLLVFSNQISDKSRNISLG